MCDSAMIGIYEKALRPASWREMLDAARFAGFAFMELSVDETPGRLARLDWGKEERADLRAAIRDTGVRVPTLCLSGHRRYGMGSADPEVRRTAADMLDKAIRLADDVGIRVVQIAGYYAYYEQPDPRAKVRYIDGLARGARCAAQYGVMLAVENIDTDDVGSIYAARQLTDEVASPWVTIYPDVGNIAVNGLDVLADLQNVGGAAVGIHLKDTRLGEPRRVPFGQGVVPFPAVFSELKRLDYSGPYMIEMWNDDPTIANEAAAAALGWIKRAMAAA